MSRATEMHGFLPDDYVELRTQRRTNILWALIFLIVAGGIGWAYFIAQNKVQKALELNTAVNNEYAAAAKPIAQFQQMQEEQQRLNQKAELVGSLVERVNRSNILAELTNSLPRGTYLTDIDLQGRTQTDASANKTLYERAKAAGIPKPIIYNVTVKVNGWALIDTQVADYIANLKKSPLLSEVNFVETKDAVVGEARLRAFELELVLDPAADSRTLGSVKQSAAVEAK